jgi:MmyB-like transcription regulator ligand binding domain
MADMPAIVMNGRLDLLATSKLGAALYSPVYDDPARPANLARCCFLDPQARALYPHWDEAANTTVAILRTEAGRHPYDRDLSDLIGELSTRSDTFGTRWANHNVRLHRTGAKVYHHPVVGRPTVEFEVMDPSADGGLALTAFTATDAASRDGLRLPASWAATLVQDDQSREAQPASQETPANQRNSGRDTRRQGGHRPPWKEHHHEQAHHRHRRRPRARRRHRPRGTRRRSSGRRHGSPTRLGGEDPRRPTVERYGRLDVSALSQDQRVRGCGAVHLSSMVGYSGRHMASWICWIGLGRSV